MASSIALRYCPITPMYDSRDDIFPARPVMFVSYPSFLPRRDSPSTPTSYGLPRSRWEASPFGDALFPFPGSRPSPSPKSWSSGPPSPRPPSRPLRRSLSRPPRRFLPPRCASSCGRRRARRALLRPVPLLERGALLAIFRERLRALFERDAVPALARFVLLRGRREIRQARGRQRHRWRERERKRDHGRHGQDAGL